MSIRLKQTFLILVIELAPVAISALLTQRQVDRMADAWGSMIGDRVYRKGMSVEHALAILDREKDDGQFDPGLIREFIAMIREEQPAADPRVNS